MPASHNDPENIYFAGVNADFIGGMGPVGTTVADGELYKSYKGTGWYAIGIDKDKKFCSFVATHSNTRALCSHKRNLTDDMIREMVRRNCLIGLNYFVKFLRDDGDVKGLDDLYRHAMHFFELGARKNLALGSDFDGSVLPECLNTPAKAASFYEYLLSRGISQEDADGVFYKNAQAFFHKNLR